MSLKAQMKFGKFERSKESVHWELTEELILKAECSIHFSLCTEDLYLSYPFCLG